MDHSQLYAHSPAVRGGPWQTLEEHLSQVATLASGFAEPFHASTWARAAAWLHDLGKSDERFQRMLREANGLDYDPNVMAGSVNHSGAGAAAAVEWFKGPIGLTLAFLVAGHHAGLPDYPEDLEQGGQASLKFRLSESSDATENFRKIRDLCEPYLRNLPQLTTEDFPKSILNPRNYHLWVRMLFSTLVDADWLDTEAFMSPERAIKRRIFPSIKELSEKFNVWMDREILSRAKANPGKLNIIRGQILSECLQAAEREPGLFTLTVPTGGGKTLASMAFALKHGLKYARSRIIYVIPYTSIIEQTADVFRKIFGDENVVEHHSSVVRDEECSELRDHYDAMDLAAENWDAPIIVTTNVQFFESLYTAKPRRARKLHNMVNSVVIMDEAQLLPPEWLAPCTDIIRHLTEMFGVSLVLCTATQPALTQGDQSWSLRSVREKRTGGLEMMSHPEELYRKLKRTEIIFPDAEALRNPLSWEDIADELCQYEQVLCVVNTRKDCRALYELLPRDEGTIHLSALMCGAHRSDVIQKIRDRLNRKLPVRVVSTQLVEAGVDIDFPVVFRALTGLDSIVQAAGRCNREGKQTDASGNPQYGMVRVFVPPKPSPRGMLRKGEDTTRELLACGRPDSDSPETYTQYFRLFYDRVNDCGEDLLNLLVMKNSPCNLYFRTVGARFRMIDDGYTRSVFVLYGAGKDLIAKLRKEGPYRNLMRQLQRYSVNIPEHVLREYLAAGTVHELEFRGEKSGIYVQYTGSIYSGESGMNLSDPSQGLSSEECIL
ncbi:MAG: CRISPR-associated helicase Cas3' [Planctomycetia bacterium]|nr:CRISPR-associated helicase Cas3' [Planctomycetia bacterium]